MPRMTEIIREDLNCPHCNATHKDIDRWAIKPHQTHLCLNCHKFFEGSVKGVSHPTFVHLTKRDDVKYTALADHIPF